MDSLKHYSDLAYNRKNFELMPMDGSGWMQPDFGRFYDDTLNLIASERRGEEIVVIEVGSWMGLSTRLMASGLKAKALRGTVVAIDTWLGSPEHVGDARLETLFEQFVSNVKHTGLEDYIIPFRISSLQGGHFLESKGVLADIVYIDAGHEYESVKLDIDVFWRLLRPGGVMLFDDYAWPGVIKAVDEHTASCGSELVIGGALAMIRKKPSA